MSRLWPALAVFALTGLVPVLAQPPTAAAIPAAKKGTVEVYFVPFEWQLCIATNRAFLLSGLRRAQASGEKDAPVKQRLTLTAGPDCEMLTAIRKAATAPARFDDGDARLLVDEGAGRAPWFVDMFGVVWDGTAARQLPAADFRRLKDLLARLYAPAATKSAPSH